MSLEKRVEEGGFYYIHSIRRDAAKKSLTVELMKAPEEMSPARRLLIFEGLEDYSAEVDSDAIEEAEDGVIDSLIALSEYLHEGKPGYELVTENRVFNFSTKVKPRIEDVLLGQSNKGMNRTRNQRGSHLQSWGLAGYPRRYTA